VKSPLFEEGYRSQFSGHETFPLRYGWLKKAFDATVESADEPNNKRTIFLADDAIARFGVGKNMVASIRHWATVTEIIEDGADRIQPTAFGKQIFGPRGHDPYMEHHATMWLLHWKLCGRATKTTWFWAFNHFGAQTFRRDDLIQGLLKLAALRGWPKASETTVRRDVECFLRTYASPAASSGGAPEDALESPLAELGLVRTIGRRDDYQFARGAKPTLPAGVFAHALNSFWEGVGATRTLSFEMVAHEPGSPGRVFLLDEAGLADRLVKLEDQTEGLFRWSETAGLRQVVRGGAVDAQALRSLIASSYKKGKDGELRT
jgi:uncharacterized protein DUF4007